MVRYLLVLACLLGAPAWAQQLAAIPPLDAPVIDTTGTLDADQKQQLQQRALALQRRKGSQLQILMIASTRPETIEQYTQRVFDQWRLGRKGVDDGVLLLVAKSDRSVRIQPGYGLEGAIPDAVAKRIIEDYLIPSFRAGDFGGGISAASAMLVKLIDGETLPAPAGSNTTAANSAAGNWLNGLFAAFVIANIVRGALRVAPAGMRGLVAGGAAAVLAFVFSSLLVVAVIAGVFGLIYGLLPASSGSRYARRQDWGGGGFGGGGFGGGGGGFGGGGGSSGGGGASGRW